MKSIAKHIFLAIICFLFQLAGLSAQGTLVLDKSKAKVDPTIAAEMMGALSSTLEKAVGDYASYCTLYDKGAKLVNAASVNRFVSLFDASAALLCKDYLFDSIPAQYDINDYFIGVMEGPMSSTGIEAVISNPVLTEMYRDVNATDQIVSKVMVTKVLKNYLQDNGTGYFLKPVTRKLVLTYRTPSYYLEEALISSIEYYSPQALSSKQVAVVPITPDPVQRKCVLIDANSVLPEGTNEDTLVQIERLICDALDKYRETATLFDSTAGAVTGASASRFQQLFSAGSSLHLSDYREYPENIEVTAYREDVFKFFRTTGVQFQLTNPRIKTISYDPDGFYFVKVQATKEVPEYLDDESYEIRKSGKKRSFEFEIDYIIVERTMSDPLIERAISTAIVKPEEKRTLLSFGPNLSTGLVSGSPKSGYEYITDNTTLGSSPGIGFQVDLISNFTAKHRAPKKPLFLAAGIGFQSFTIEAETMDIELSIEDPETLDGISGMELRQIDQLVDKIPMKILGLPLGVEYRLSSSENRKFEWFLGGKIAPSFLLSSESSFNSDGFYNLTYEQYGFSFYNEDKGFQLKPENRSDIDSLYGIGAFNVEDNKGSEIGSKFLLGYKLETSILINLSANFYLNARVGYGGYFGDFITPSDTTPPFPLSAKPKPGQIVDRKTLFEDYYNSIELSYLSFSVGLAYRLN